MASAVLVRQGTSLGCTYYGHQDMRLGDDPITKTHEGHYTLYMANVMLDNRLAMILEDVFSRGYVSGENMQAFKNADELVGALNGTNREAAYKSLIFLPVPADTDSDIDAPKIANPLDVTGKYPEYVLSGEDVQEPRDHYPGSSNLLPLEVRTALGRKKEVPMTFSSDLSYVNTVCWRGAQRQWNYYGGGFTDEVQNTGHWGRTYEGCKRVRNGEAAFLRQSDGPACLS
jgi:hypothetical protein